MAAHALHLGDDGSERRIHFGASEMGGSGGAGAGTPRHDEVQVDIPQEAILAVLRVD